MTITVAEEPFRMEELPGWLCWNKDQGTYGQRCDTYGDDLKTELHFRRFPLEHYRIYPISGNKGAYWHRTGDRPPCLRAYFTDEPLPEETWEEMRGETLSYYVSTFKKRFPDKRLTAMLSFGDCGVNQQRGLFTRQELVWVPHSIGELAEPRLWLVGWRTGYISVEWLCVEAEVHNGQIKPVSVKRWSHEKNEKENEDVLEDIEWAITGLPVIIDGQPNEEAVWRLDDDMRHPFETPLETLPGKDKCYILEKALLEARAGGWCPSEPLEVDLSLYSDTALVIQALRRAAYWEVYKTPTQAGEFQMISPNRILCRPKPAGYGVSILGLCKDGSLGSYMATAPSTDRGYFAPSVGDQIRMVAPFFAYAFILDEGRDPTYYDLSVPPDEFPVRGQPNGHLSAVVCVYEM